MARPTIEQIRQMGDFLSLYRWDVTLTPPAAITGLPSSEKLNFRCETTEIPKLTGQPITVSIRGHQVKQPGIYNYDNTFTIMFVETTDVVIHQYIRTWREALWKVRQGVSAAPKNQLQGTIILNQLDNQDNPVWQYTLYGVFVESYDMQSLDGSSSDSQKPSVTFSYDYFDDQQLTNAV